MRIPEELRVTVVQRAMFRCEYCLLHQDDGAFPHEVDHIISRQHGGETSAENLAYACMILQSIQRIEYSVSVCVGRLDALVQSKAEPVE